MNSSTDLNRIANAAAQAARSAPGRVVRAPRGTELHCKSWLTEAARQHYGGDLAGRWILTAGLGGMGGAQPLAATFAGAVSLNIECQQASIDFRLRTRYLDKQARDLDDALALIQQHVSRREAVSIGVLGNAAEVLPELVRRAR